MYVVIAGKVRISKRVAGVGEEALGILEAGSHFGEMAMVDDARAPPTRSPVPPARSR